MSNVNIIISNDIQKIDKWKEQDQLIYTYTGK